MVIKKIFKGESAHIVRNCSSEYCKKSIHGHSYIVELELESKTLDNADMVYDFGLLKGNMGKIINSMDHCYLLNSNEDQEFKYFIKSHCERWIEMPFNPSAEMLSIMIFKFAQYLMDHTIPGNGEGKINVKSVRYHETTTGSALASKEDVENIFDPKFKLNQIVFSPGILEEWSKELKDCIFNSQSITNPATEQQVPKS